MATSTAPSKPVTMRLERPSSVSGRTSVMLSSSWVMPTSAAWCELREGWRRDSICPNLTCSGGAGAGPEMTGSRAGAAGAGHTFAERRQVPLVAQIAQHAGVVEHRMDDARIDEGRYQDRGNTNAEL